MIMLERRYAAPIRYAVAITAALIGQAEACTRTLYVGAENTIITGRSMDWMEDLGSNLWIFPRGLERDGAAGPRPIKWRSKYGSVVTSGYEAGTADGLNEKGLAANLLYLAESEYGPPNAKRPNLSIAAWGQYVLDNYATVAETVSALSKEPFNLIAPTLPNGSPAALHLSISDASGDSAVFEYIRGKLTIHHGKQYKVMTNSPAFDQQLAIEDYWRSVGGSAFLPGTNRPADRFVRACFFLEAVPKETDPHYIRGVPEQSYAYQAVAEVISVMRAVSVPLGVTTPGKPNIASTLWRTAADQRNLVYYFDSATRPNTFWVSLGKADLKPGAPVKKLTIEHGEVFSGETIDNFEEATPFRFLSAEGK